MQLRKAPGVLLQEATGASAPQAGLKPVKLAASASVVCALGVIALLSANAASRGSILVLSTQALAVVSASLGVFSLAVGLRLLWARGPEVRKPLAFLLVLTLGILLAHLYIVNSPPTATQAPPISGRVGTAFGDSHLEVSSSLAGSTLRIHLANIGSDANSSYHAIGRVALSLDGVPLPSLNLSPDPTYLNPLQPESTAFTGFPTESQGVWTVQATTFSRLNVTYQYLTCYHVPDSADRRGVMGCVMDESYYVPAALSLLSGAQCAPYADNCNLEHPPLAKALVAGGIAVFGLDDFGWRIANVVLGTLSVPLLFVLVRSLTKEGRLPYFAALVFAADILFFVHSSAALIDVPAVFFSLLGFIFYFRRSRLWRLNNYLASGIFLGLAALSKETALFALAAIVTYELLLGEGGLQATIVRTLEVVLAAVIVFAGAIQLYDSLFSSSTLPWFYNQVWFMLTYGASLRGGGWCLNAGSCPNGPYITPLNWLTSYTPVSYLVTTVTITVSGAAASTLRYISIGYYGVANNVIVWMVFLWLPLVLYPLLRRIKWRSALAQADRLGAFLAVWFLWLYLPYVALWLYGRVTYPFYFLPAIPALAGGAAYFITRPWFPRKMALIYVIAAFAIFFLYFPVKDFLPGYVRAWLGR
jgi:4-amino-4-deoxy-L-arabinose transferase-like glycosyltransferase